MALGVFAGMVAVAFHRTIFTISDAFKHYNVPYWISPAIAGLGVGLVALVLPQVMGSGDEVINMALTYKLVVGLLFILIIAKLLVSALCVAAGFPGGIIAPTLFIGAMLGGFSGFLGHSMFPEISATGGAYALVGMGAMLSGMTYSPISAILIIFELTGTYEIILPVMTSVVIGTIVARIFSKDSIYTIRLKRKGIDPSQLAERDVMKTVTVAQVMTRDFPSVPPSMAIPSLFRQMRSEDRRVGNECKSKQC